MLSSSLHLQLPDPDEVLVAVLRPGREIVGGAVLDLGEVHNHCLELDLNLVAVVGVFKALCVDLKEDD